jgi:hypothetical protein
VLFLVLIQIVALMVCEKKEEGASKRKTSFFDGLPTQSLVGFGQETTGFWSTRT